MNIAILNYPSGTVDFIDDVPEIDGSKEIERWLEDNGYDLDDIYYMADCNIEHFKVINNKIQYIGSV